MNEGDRITKHGGSRLGGKRATVTGSSSSIGRAIAQLFTAHGVRVTGYEHAAPAPDLATFCEMFVAGDAGDTASVKAFVDDVAQRFCGIDVLIDNIGADALSDPLTQGERIGGAISTLTSAGRGISVAPYCRSCCVTNRVRASTSPRRMRARSFQTRFLIRSPSTPQGLTKSLGINMPRMAFAAIRFRPDFLQVSLPVLGGFLIAALTLSRIGRRCGNHRPPAEIARGIRVDDVSYRTSQVFNVGALIIMPISIILYG